MRPLRVGNGFELPAELLTQTVAILAKRGVGKTYTAAVIAEELLEQGLLVVVVDPIGVWWGLRSSADGKGPGYPVPVFGGEHGDLAIAAGAGKALASLIVEERLSAVVDLSLLRKGEQRQFMTDFAETLYHVSRHALHLILDEADAWAPQRPLHGAERLLGAIEDIVRRGRARGLGVTMITQRPAVLHKDVLSQAEVLVALRLIHELDRKSIENWVRAHGAEQRFEELKASLASLPIGTAWFWSPGWGDVFERVEVRRRRTFDSSATPAAGAAQVEPRALADVDLRAIEALLAKATEKATESDPKALRAKIDRLEAELRKAVRSGPAPSPDLLAAERERGRAEGRAEAQAAIQEASAALRVAGEQIGRALEVCGALASCADAVEVAPSAPVRKVRALSVSGHAVVQKPAQRERRDEPVDLGKAARAILAVVAQYPEGCERNRAALVAGYSPRKSTLRNAISELRVLGYVKARGSALVATPLGVEALGGVEPLPTGEELREYWRRQLGGADLAMFDQILRAYPRSIHQREAGRAAGYDPNTSTIRNAASKLRTLGLVTGGRGELRAVAELLE